MITVEDREAIRRAYYLNRKSKRQIAREQGHSRKTIDKAVENLPPQPYRLTKPKAAPVFGPFQARADELLTQNDHLPSKQQYTSHKIFEVLQAEGYHGSESRVRLHFTQWNKNHRAPALFLPLEFEPGKDAQVDWGEAIAIIAGVKQTVQIFVMWLSHSRRRFVMAFPSQKQESFFYGHTCAFDHFGGVPWRISYDNLSTAIQVMTRGKGRRENQTFVSFRSYYLFDSHFCQPAAGWEKGGVEASVGFSRRNFMVPIPDVASFEDLNLHLLKACLKDDQRRVSRQLSTIGQMWEHERPLLRSLPPFAYDCCATTSARLNGYSLVTYETNRYSVPVNRARQDVIVKAYPFHLEILDGTTLLARHPRCYEREQDLFEPLHYLALLEMRPGAFDYARPLKKWQADWQESYHRMLRGLRERWPEGGRGVQEFIRVLRLHEEYPASLVQQAIEQALSYGCPHLDGVLHCLHQLTSPIEPPTSLELAEHPHLQAVGTQPIDLRKSRTIVEIIPVRRESMSMMQHQSLLETYLRQLRLPTFAQNYAAFAQDAARTGLSCERYLFARSSAEIAQRDANRVERSIAQAKLPVLKELSQFDWSCIQGVSKTRVLELAQGGYITQAEPILMIGNPGLGKSHVATGLALAACRQGKRVRFYNVASLVNDLLSAQQELKLSRFMAGICKQDLLVLDEFGFIPFSRDGAHLLFQLCSALYERSAIIITSNLKFGDWNSVMGEEHLTAALLDRLTHRAHILEFLGESFRFRQQLGRSEPRGEEGKSEAT